MLKQEVRTNIPEETFIALPNRPPVGYDLEVAGAERGWFSVNLQVLWTSPNITFCDMALLSHMLSIEIYHHSDLLEVIQV